MEALLAGSIYLFFLGFVLTGFTAQGQVAQGGAEEQLEILAAQEESAQPEDDGSLTGAVPCVFCAIDINRAGLEDWLQLPGMQPVVAQAIMTYRRQFGPFIHLMELQAVPGLSTDLLRQLLPYLKLGLPNEGHPTMRSRLRGGDHVVILRSAQAWERFSRSSGQAKTRNPFLGQGASLLFRYGYRYGRDLQWGFALEKDGGERLFPGNVWKGTDFSSFHLAARHLGPIRALVAGDYVINLGQGLIHWQGMAFGKSIQSVMINRQGETIRPYSGIDENRFHRGVAMDLGGGKLGAVVFLAADRMDGNRTTDSAHPDHSVVTSFQWTGLHRTEAEREDKDAIQQRMAGASVSYRHPSFKLALNGLAYAFGPSIRQGDAPYQRYNIQGKSWWNLSADYSLVWRNMYLFGELGLSPGKGLGLIQGLIAALDARLDLSILFRSISPAFKSLQSNAFTELSSPSNETGLYLGIQFRPAARLALNGYFDAWFHPWLRYRVHGPSTGRSGMLALNWRPSKTIEWTGSFRYRKTQGNGPSDGGVLALPVFRSYYQYRFQFSFKPDRFVEIRQRADLTVAGSVDHARGWAQSFETIYQLPKGKYSMAVRVSWFSSDLYDTRIFQYERDVLNYYSISTLDRRGIRAYLVLTGSLPGKISFQNKVFCTVYNDIESFTSYSPQLLPALKWGFRTQFIRHF
jgi:hypothetical protein